jgi:soluble cytochrome b562
MNPSTPDPAAAELKAMQDSIYREKILRARRQTPEERLADVFELTNAVFARMHEGAMWQAEITDHQKGWEIVRQRLDRLRKVNEAGRFLDHPNPCHNDH